MVKEFITDVCEILKINKPIISYDTSSFETDTMMAQCSSDGSTIYLKKCDKPNPDQFFAIAHELRHVWQIKSDKDFYLSNYKTIDQCDSLEDYNLQIAEIDANAFSGLIMIEFFNIKPLFQNLPDSVKAKIHKRMDYLKSSYNQERH